MSSGYGVNYLYFECIGGSRGQISTGMDNKVNSRCDCFAFIVNTIRYSDSYQLAAVMRQYVERSFKTADKHQVEEEEHPRRKFIWGKKHEAGLPACDVSACLTTGW